MTTDLVPALAASIQRDLWNDLVHAPPDQPLMRDTCALAAQLKISGFLTRRDGTALAEAQSFIVATDGLLHRIELLGGFRRVGNSMAATIYLESAKLADALLDCIAAGTA
jgi:hypothetical protein